MTRKDFLSFLMASGVALSVLHAWHLAKPPNAGTAYAYAHNSADQATKSHPSSDKAQLLKTVSHTPANLLKMTGQDVRRVLHEPGLVKKDLPTVIWQYRSHSCVLDIFFESRASDAGFSPVVHYEMRAREKGVSDESVYAVCLPEIMREHNAPRMVDAAAFYKSP